MSINLLDVSIYSMLYRFSPKKTSCLFVFGFISSLLSSLIVPFMFVGLNRLSDINLVQNESNTIFRLIDANFVLVFCFFCFLIISLKTIIVIGINNIGKSAAEELKVATVKKINGMGVAHVERAGFSHVISLLTDDINSITAGSSAIPAIFTSVLTIIGLLGFLAFTNLNVFIVVLLGLIIGVRIYVIPGRVASNIYTNGGSIKDNVIDGVRGLVLGIYELKLSRVKSSSFIEEKIVAPLRSSFACDKKAEAMLHIGGGISELLSFFTIITVVFILPIYIDFPTKDRVTVIMIMLYISGPMAAILGSIRPLKVGQVSLLRIQALHKCCNEAGCALHSNFGNIGSIESKNIFYSYPKDDGSDGSFSVGPINLIFKSGEINFLVGGNGSGKTTLAKLLSLHYSPSSGSVIFNDSRIDDFNIIEARSRISVIYSGYYLFDKVYSDKGSISQELVETYIELLKLNGKTAFVDGRFTVTNELSDGQRRRVALLIALLEDKDIYVFDEWAADQDPLFKEIFYTKILKWLKEKNKIIIVITHDDRYFRCADHVVWMEYGSVSKIENSFSNADVVECVM